MRGKQHFRLLVVISWRDLRRGAALLLGTFRQKPHPKEIKAPATGMWAGEVGCHRGVVVGKAVPGVKLPTCQLGG